MIQSVEEAVQKAEHRYLTALQRGGKWDSNHSFISDGFCVIRVTVVTADHQTLWEEQIHIHDKLTGSTFEYKQFSIFNIENNLIMFIYRGFINRDVL